MPGAARGWGGAEGQIPGFNFRIGFVIAEKSRKSGFLKKVDSGKVDYY